MRERTIKSIFDKVMWYGAYLFPLIAYVALLFSFQYNGANSYIPFDKFMFDLGFGHGEVFLVFGDIFGDGGLFPMADYAGFFAYANYLVFITILHVIFDVIVFIPRLFHNFLDSLEKGDIIK